MSKDKWLRIALVCHYLAALALPWQTKLIVSPALSDYWEISVYAAWVFIWLGLLTSIPAGLFSGRKFPRLLIISASLMILAGIASALLSVSPSLTFYYLILLLSGAAFFITTSSLDAGRRRIMIALGLLSLAVQAAIGIWQFITQLSFSSTILGIAYHHAGDLGTAVVEVSDGRWLRAYGASGHPNAFGGLMAIGAIGVLYFFVREQSKLQRVLALALFVLFISGAIVSFSRAAWLALGVGLIVLCLENWRDLLSRWKGSAIIFLMSCLVIFAFYSSYQPLFYARTQVQGRLEEMSISERGVYNARAWSDFLERPMTGTGLAASTAYDREKDLEKGGSRKTWAYQPAHNYWLLAATEGGIFFLLALLGIWIGVIKKSRSNRLLALPTIIFFLSLFDHWLLSLPLSTAWISFLFALMW